MTDQTTDADLIELVDSVIDQYRDGSGAVSGEASEAVIAAVQPIIAAQARAEGRREALEVLRSGFVDRWQAAKHLQLWHTQRVWSEAIELIDLRLDTGAAADGEEKPHAQ